MNSYSRIRSGDSYVATRRNRGHATGNLADRRRGCARRPFGRYSNSRYEQVLLATNWLGVKYHTTLQTIAAYQSGQQGTSSTRTAPRLRSACKHSPRNSLQAASDSSVEASATSRPAANHPVECFKAHGSSFHSRRSRRTSPVAPDLSHRPCRTRPVAPALAAAARMAYHG